VIDLGNLCEPWFTFFMPRPRPPQRVDWRFGGRIAADNQRREFAGLPQLAMIRSLSARLREPPIEMRLVLFFLRFGIDPDATRLDDECGGAEDVHEGLLRQYRLVIAFDHDRDPLAGVLDPGCGGADERADGWAEIDLILR
jgi:hypothetical protein